MNLGLLGLRRIQEIPCMIEVERSRETLHAHVSLEGIEVNEGDEVTVLRAPTHLDFGERLEIASHATIVRANAAERYFTRLRSYLELTELYEVGFQPKE